MGGLRLPAGHDGPWHRASAHVKQPTARCLSPANALPLLRGWRVSMDAFFYSVSCVIRSTGWWYHGSKLQLIVGGCASLPTQTWVWVFVVTLAFADLLTKSTCIPTTCFITMLLFCEYAVTNPNLKTMTPQLVWLLKVNNWNVKCWRIYLTELQGWRRKRKRKGESES